MFGFKTLREVKGELAEYKKKYAILQDHYEQLRHRVNKLNSYNEQHKK